MVTKPFHFEGLHRMRVAEAGIQELQQFVDTLIIIPNQNLFRIANEKTTFADAFKMADEVLHSGVRGVTDLMVMPGLINLDFADIRAVMTEMGKAMMGTGEAEGRTGPIGAAEAAISNPLLDDVSMKGARGVLINITGGLDMTLFEVDEAANRIRSEVDPDANIIFGSTFDQSLEGKVRISVVATGIETMAGQMPRPVSLSLVSNGNGGRPAMTAEPSLGAVHAAAPSPAPSIRRDIVGATALAMPQTAMPQPAAPQAAPLTMPPVMAEAPRAMPAPMAQQMAAPQIVVQPAQAQPVEQRHYVAPPPVETMAPAAMQVAPAQPAPMAAPLVSTPAPAAAAQPRRAPNLFSRVTGNAASWAKQAVEPAITPQMRASAPAKPAPAAGPVLQVPQPASARPAAGDQPACGTHGRAGDSPGAANGGSGHAGPCGASARWASAGSPSPGTSARTGGAAASFGTGPEGPSLRQPGRGGSAGYPRLPAASGQLAGRRWTGAKKGNNLGATLRSSPGPAKPVRALCR